YATRQNTTRSLRRPYTNGRRERTDQVRTEELGKHQSATSRARGGRNHQRTKNDEVMGLLDRPHGHSDEHRWEKPRMISNSRNLHRGSTVSADKSTRRSRYAPACIQPGELAKTSPRETRKEGKK